MAKRRTERMIVRTICVVVLCAGSLVHAQTTNPISYETHCKLPDLESKQASFDSTTPENRAQLVRTQLERWQAGRKASLSDKQKAALADVMKFVTTDAYSYGPQGDAERLKARPLIEQIERLFTKGDIEAMGPLGPCLAKVK